MSFLPTAIIATVIGGSLIIGSKLKNAYDLNYNVTGFRFIKGSSYKNIKGEVKVLFENKKSQSVTIQRVTMDILVNNNLIAVVEAAPTTKGIKTQKGMPSQFIKIPAITVNAKSTYEQFIPIDISVEGVINLIKQTILSKTLPKEIIFKGKVEIGLITIPFTDSEPLDIEPIKQHLTDAKNIVANTQNYLDTQFKTAIQNLINAETNFTTGVLSIYKSGVAKKFASYQTTEIKLFQYNVLTSKFVPVQTFATTDDFNNYLKNNNITLVDKITI